ncbi:MAG TPA: molybdopterin biosynthesis protein [Ruminiclostridium sp.]|nr:molybdopterin biosynthesis protein [Ruminiclostridium sp.]
MGKRNLYLSNTPVEEAISAYLGALGNNVKVSYEKIPTIEALNRTTKSAVYAKYSSPLYNSAAMDGIAVISSRTNGASEAKPVDLIIGEDYKIVDTGDPIHQPFDSVIMAEDLINLGDGKVRIIASAAPWSHIRPIGEDFVAGEMILPSNHRVRPIDIGVLLSAGILELEVIRKTRVAIFQTGTEIIEPTETPKDGDIIESNSRMFENMITVEGGVAYRHPTIEDDYNKIKEKVSAAAKEYDMVIVNAGSSAGMEDFTVHVLRELGTVLVHGVAIKPGKPVILAIVNGKPVIGLPGYPVAAYVDFKNFVSPVLAMSMGSEAKTKGTVVEAKISKRLVSSLKHKEYVRVKVGRVGNKIIAAPLARGAGAAMSLVRSDGFCVIEQNSEGVEAGDSVKVELYRSLDEIENTLVIIGSHDLIIDVIADMIQNKYKNMFVSSTHVGSMAGLMSLKRGEAHMSPIHLLDEQTGEYNIPYIKRMFENKMAIIRGVGRIQGFIVKKGNPLGIYNIKDLKRCRYVNRQRGAGTRILFDFKLKEEGISPAEISGYDNEMTTHMAVAALVKSEEADVGMGVKSAANAMNLDFIPIGLEQYDFAIPQEYLNLDFVKAFIAVLKLHEFKEKLKALGGYSDDKTGDIIKI